MILLGTLQNQSIEQKNFAILDQFNNVDPSGSKLISPDKLFSMIDVILADYLSYVYSNQTAYRGIKFSKTMYEKFTLNLLNASEKRQIN